MRYYQTLPRRKKKYTRVRAYILTALRPNYLFLTVKNIVKYIAQWQFFSLNTIYDCGTEYSNNLYWWNETVSLGDLAGVEREGMQ